MPEHDEHFITHSETLVRLGEGLKHVNERVDTLSLVANSVQELTIGFTKLVGNMESIANNLTTIVKTLDRHEEKIEGIEDKMETKDTVMKLYERMDKADVKHTESVNAIMNKLRQQDDALDEHKLKPLSEAYAREKSIKKWLVGAVGAIIASQYLPDIISSLLAK